MHAVAIVTMASLPHEENKDLHMCSSVSGRKEDNLPLYLHAEEEPQRQKMNGGSLLYLPDRPSSFFFLWANRSGASLPGVQLGGLAAPPPHPAAQAPLRSCPSPLPWQLAALLD